MQGGVTSAILNAVVAEDLPGPGTVFLHVNWSFKAPVRPGDTITGRPRCWKCGGQADHEAQDKRDPTGRYARPRRRRRLLHEAVEFQIADSSS